MTRVYFLSIFHSLDSVSSNLLFSEMKHLAEQDDHLEFWFMSCHNSYDRTAVNHVLELQSMFPTSQIDIVAVVDPLKNEVLSIEEFSEVREGFPCGSVTKFEYAPRIVGKCEQIPSRFVEHHRKVERWIIKQCDVLLAYHYECVPDYTNSEIKRIKRNERPRIISIYNPDIAARMEAFIDTLDGREGVVLRGLRDGRTYKSLGIELGITINRVQQLSHRGIRQMNREISKCFQ